jgi:DNA-binding MarR family transcriptional regulator
MSTSASRRRPPDRPSALRRGNGGRGQAAKPADKDRFFVEAFIPYLLNHVVDRYNKQFKQALKSVGLTIPQWRVIAVLNASDGLSFTEIQDLTVIDQPTLSRTVEQMVGRGIVLRTNRPNDARYAVVSLTDKGRKAYETVWPVAWNAFAHGVRGISESAQRQLLATLKQMLANLREPPFTR